MHKVSESSGIFWIFWIFWTWIWSFLDFLDFLKIGWVMTMDVFVISLDFTKIHYIKITKPKFIFHN